MSDHSITIVGDIVQNSKYRWIRQNNFYFIWYPEERLPDSGYVKVTATLRELDINHSARNVFLNIDTIEELEPLED